MKVLFLIIFGGVILGQDTEQINNDLWSTAIGEENTYPLVFRFRHNIPKGINVKEFPFLLNICWSYNSENNGMPNEEDNDNQIEFEDETNSIEDNNLGHLMLVVTGNGRKEFLWYISNKENCMIELASFIKKYPAYTIEVEINEDADWEIWKGFINNISEQENTN